MRRMAERALLGAGILIWYLGLAPLVRWWRRRAPRVLLYHAVAEREDDFLAGLDSNTPPAAFSRQLDYLARYHTVVPLATLETGRWPNGAAAITFDDGYRSVFTTAFPLLRQRKLPAALYVVTEAVGNGQVIWVNELAWLLNRSPAARRRVAGALGAGSKVTTGDLVQMALARFETVETSQLLDNARRVAGEPDMSAEAHAAGLYVSWDEARELAQGGVVIGNHTATHPPLSRLLPAEQEDEMRRGREAIERELGGCTSLAYPFGDHNAASLLAAERTGHRSVMEVGVRRRPGPMQMGRVTLRERTDAGIFAELEVVAPFKARWKARRKVPAATPRGVAAGTGGDESAG